MLNVDTHVLIDAMIGNLPAREESLLRSETWSISAIVLWELAKLGQLGRIELDLDDPDVERFLAQIHVWPVSLEVVRALTRLDFFGSRIVEQPSHHAPPRRTQAAVLGSGQNRL